MSGLQAVKRFGALQAAWMAASDWVLVDALEPHEALIDFIAVAPEARLRGIGSALVRWAESVATQAAAGNPQAALILWVRALAFVHVHIVLDFLCIASQLNTICFLYVGPQSRQQLACMCCHSSQSACWYIVSCL